MSEDWKTQKLGDLVTFQRGHDLPKTQMTIGKYPVAGSNGIIGFHDEFTTKAPSITIGRSGNIGNPHYYETDFWAHNTTLYIKEFKGSFPKFVYYFLKTLDFKGHNSGSAVPSLNRNYIHPIEIKVPPIEEQRRIAEILSVLDEKIELNQAMNRTLERIAQATFKHWFVDFQFPGFDGELVDGLPKGWRKAGIGEIIFIQNGYAFKSSDFKAEGKNGVIKIKNISNKVVDIENMQFIGEDITKIVAERFRILGGDLLIAMTGAEVGKVGIVPNTDKYLWLNQRVGIFKEKIEFAKWFVYLILSTNEYQNVLFNSAMGSAQPNISSSQIERVESTIPTENIIKQFGELVNSFFERICENYFENQTLTQIRNGLLPKLMSGKIRVAE